MRDSNLVVRLSNSERHMVDQLQDKHAINISQYVRNNLNYLDSIVNGDTTYVPIYLKPETKEAIKKLRDEFHCDPIGVLTNALDDESINEIIEANISAIYKKHTKEASK